MKGSTFNILVGIAALFPLASASPLLASPLARDVSTDCPAAHYTTGGNYTTQNGLPLYTFCNQDLLYPELGNKIESSFELCINACSTYSGCYGVAWYAQNETCSFKGSGVNATFLNMTDAENINSAFLVPHTMISINPDCPHKDGDTVVSNGLAFQIHCDKDMKDIADFRPWGTSYTQHAGSLDDCINLCTEAHPLCLGVSWNPDKLHGWGNCYLKVNRNGHFTQDSSVTVHTAVVKDQPTAGACTDLDTQILSNGTTFTASCSNGLVGSSNITSLYSTNITTCVDQCTSWTNDTCVGVFYDNSLTNGYMNCYLLNATGSSADSSDRLASKFSYAELDTSNTAGSSTSPPASSNTTGSSASSSGISGHSSSKAWIAGPVIGAVAAVAIFLIAFFWWRRREASGAEMTTQEPIKKFHNVEVESNPIRHEMSHNPLTEMEGSKPAHELPSR